MNEQMTIDDVLDLNATFEPAVVRATRKLAKSKPWQGDFDDRLAKLQAWLNAVTTAYELDEISLTHTGPTAGDSGASTVVSAKEISLSGRLSVTTVMHLFHKCRQIQTTRRLDHLKAIRWSVSLFAKRFPISFSRCRFEGGMLFNDNRRDD